MTRLIITGRNSAMPRDAAQSMAYMMPTPWPSYEDRLRQFMREHNLDNREDAIEALVWGYQENKQ
jgi:hypothetical protein